MDITTDGFGFMLSVGDLAWVPFAYCLQARYLVFTPVVLGPVWTVVILLFNFTGYYIFRTANAEKNDFRNGKNPKSSAFFFHLSVAKFDVAFPDLEFMTTESGSKLLTSGWWGRSRHPNYLYDNFSFCIHGCSQGFMQRRSLNVLGVVITDRVHNPDPFLLCRLLPCPAYSQTATRR
jgi:hypothetical protein